MPHPLVGKPAPSISLPDANGETFTLTPGANGVPVALFFYPKSGSFGCTKEACQFRNALAENDMYKSSSLSVVGISPDSVEKQKAFVEKHKLTYPVLSDTSGEARNAYHVGKGLFGLADSARVTFFIDSKGIVRDSLESTLNYGSHAKFVTKWLGKIKVEESKASEAPAGEAAPADTPPTTDAPAPDAPADEATEAQESA